MRLIVSVGFFLPTQSVNLIQLFVHPKILDGDGETMSKSKGNGIDPLDVIDKFGADAFLEAVLD